ncbi:MULTISPECIES: hypothetical protein [unclassified Rathayibacter]|uniref:hypothetical protein n=1 Tax=unclassified Rathayibacter TaxID=2609250 RepID=UPI00188BB4B8|nr:MULTISPECIES: hypothetical protein [unclassified Rathayibacter]MBF4460949.1 hypothetical protein [Rathayibacter sp. VKM Ac-2879]MBF4502360.1 hypothetical protein [Rathayibacter sp. VKM Ac-2878]
MRRTSNRPAPLVRHEADGVELHSVATGPTNAAQTLVVPRGIGMSHRTFSPLTAAMGQRGRDDPIATRDWCERLLRSTHKGTPVGFARSRHVVPRTEPEALACEAMRFTAALHVAVPTSESAA